MKQQQQQKSLALELNKYLSHWKALGLFSKYVHQNAGGAGPQAHAFGVWSMQEAFLRATVSLGGGMFWFFFFFRGRKDGGVVCLLSLWFYTVSLRLFPVIDEWYRGRVQRARPLPAASVPVWSFLALEIQPFPPFPFAKVIRVRCAASPLPASASLGACSAIAGERRWTSPTFLEEDPP